MKFCVIGLGRFGYQVATILAENGMEVMAVDSNETIVDSIKDLVTQAICLHVTDEETLRSIGVADMDTVVVAMGEDFAQSILITAIIKKHLNVPTVITRAVNEIHKEILNLVGADRVILPEKEIGVRLADNLSSPFTDLVRLTNECAVSHITTPVQFIGKKIADLDLFGRYRIYCIGIRVGEEIAPVAPDYTIREKDRLVCIGDTDGLERIAKLG
jgi:trk system potassium uptake protein TrkA